MPDSVLELQNLGKSFNGNAVLDSICFDLYKGEVHAILGENGSGKSTLVKILAGVCKKDNGKIFVNGIEIEINSPIQSKQKRLNIIYQETYLYENLTVAENICSENLPVKGRFFRRIDKKATIKKASEILCKLNFSLNPNSYVRELDFAQKRMVEIARAFSQNSEILIMDEPTSSISEQECESLFKLINTLKSMGISIIYISQKLEDIFKIADRITILRDGHVQCTCRAEEIKFQNVTKLMSGEDYFNRYPKLKVKIGKEILSVKNLYTHTNLKNICFNLNKGEIIGFTGLAGSGRSEFAKTLFGYKHKEVGSFYLDKVKVRIDSPYDAIKLGFAYIAEDRLLEGLFPNLKVIDNLFVIENNDMKNMLINTQEEKVLLKNYIKKVNLNSFDKDKKVILLSGGSQQKIMLLKWFITNSRIFIFDEPTKAIDVAAKVDIYNLMNNLARKGASLIVVSSDIEELIGICDRIFVMYEGTIIKEFTRENATSEKVYHYCLGGK